MDSDRGLSTGGAHCAVRGLSIIPFAVVFFLGGNSAIGLLSGAVAQLSLAVCAGIVLMCDTARASRWPTISGSIAGGLLL